jgi:adenylate cyclase
MNERMYDFRRPNAIRTEQRDVTLLFADLRGFTELAGSLQTDPLVSDLLANVMDCLTEAVDGLDGFVVDYYGDGLVAMWNAPTEQANHAQLACRAGLQMLSALPAVSDDWKSLIHTELRLGIGVHTGSVQVGNAGSKKKTKYGPRGPNVNLASRVEAATKELSIPLVATQPTAEQLSDEFATNRICCARMPGLQRPVNLYAISASTIDSPSSIAWECYDKALQQFEKGDFAAAADSLAHIDQAITEVPWRFLVERVERELGRERRRRSTDKPPAHPSGVISLSAK